MARLALLVALVALVLAWAAYRRAGGELKEVWSDASRGSGLHLDGLEAREGKDGAASALDRQADLARAEGRLLQRRAEVAGDRNLEQVRREVEEIRVSLEQAYDHSGGDAKERWKGLDGDLDRLESQLKDGGAKALATLDSALAKIRSEAGEGEKGEGKDERRSGH
jgi:hypothetical protein